MSDPDELLVSRSRGGDRMAFEELVRRTARAVYARIYLETGDAHRAEDLVQETFLTAWRCVGQMTDPTGFRPWLFSIAHSTMVDAQRREMRKKRWGSRAPAEELGKLASAQPPPAEAAAREESRQRVLGALRSLPEEYRLPLTLRYIGGADYQTIGQELGLTNGSLRGLLRRGMEMMRRVMTTAE